MVRGKQSSTERRGRGRGRGRGAGGAGAGTQREWATPGPDASEPSTSRQGPPAPRTVDEDLALIRQRRVDKRAKEFEHIRLPDAPVPKRARKNSPQRVPCRLVVGTPSTPPQPKPQSWQIQPLTPSEPASSIPSPLMCDFTSGGLWTEAGLHGLSGPPTTATELSGLQCAVEVSPPPACRQASAASSFDDGSIGPSVFGEDVVIDPAHLRRALVAPPSAPAAGPAHADPGLPGPSRGVSVGHIEGQNKVRHWQDEMSDSSDEEDSTTPLRDLDAPDHDFAADAPAFAHDELDAVEASWLTQHDEDTDRVVRQIMTDDQLTFDWSHDVDSFRGQREEFRGQCGPQFLIDDNTKPVDVFLKYFTDEVLDVIVTETNRQIDRVKATPLPPHSRFNDVAYTNRSEILKFTAMLILQGLCPLPVEHEYWQSKGYLGLHNYKLLMSRNRFVQLKKMLYFSDSDLTTENMNIDDVNLRKLGPLLNLFNSKFSELYLPSRDIAIDESLLKWHGRLNFAQKIATKAAKVGVKSYELCDSKTGYLWKFFIYTEKGQTHGQTDNSDQDAQKQVAVPSNITAQIVVDLVEPLLNRGHTLTMDNFYNSPLLARYLKANGTDCLGTLRINREFVPESIKGVSKNELRPGDVVQSYCRDMSILLWRDKNIVSMISTFHRGEDGGKEKHGQKNKYKPQAVLDYNLSMGGVDKKDQFLSSHPIERVLNQAWYKKVYRRLVNTTVLNAYIAFKTHFPKYQQRQFRKTLANELIERSKTLSIERPREARVVRVIPCGKHQRCILTGNHFVGRGETRFTRCVWCKIKRSKFKCKQCDVTLCLDVCFEAYHTAE